MISAVSNTSPVYASNYKSSLEKEAITNQSALDTFEMNSSKYFMQYTRLLREDSLKFNGEIDDVLHNVSSNYNKVLEDIENQGGSEEEKLEKVATLNYVFEMTLRSEANKDVFRSQNNAIMNYAYSTFLLSNEFKDYEGVPYESKSKKIMENHDKNMGLIFNTRKQVDRYVNAFYEELINSIKTKGLKEAYTNATDIAKQKMSEQNISYDELNAFIKNDLPRVGNEYYWYTYNPTTNQTYKHNH